MKKKIGIASDHGGFELKEYLKDELRNSGYELVDFGNSRLNIEDDYPDFVIPLANAVAEGDVDRGIAVCGSGVGACVTVNKIKGVRGCLIGDTFSAHQGVEDDDMNVLCLGGRVTGRYLSKDIVRSFLEAEYIGAERHNRRLEKIRELERRNS